MKNCKNYKTKPTAFVAFKALAPIEMKLVSAISKKD